MPHDAGKVRPGVTSLSESLLWTGLRGFYSSKGPTAWPQHVPFHATSNGFIADAYANVIVRLVQDLLSTDRLERSEPLYVVELGAGSSRFSFLALTRLAAVMKALAPEFEHVVYVMTDFASANLEAWQADESLAPFLASGSLQFALFDASRDSVLAIDGAAELTPARPARNPIVVIANYVLDSLPQDLFRWRDDGGLDEGLVEVVTGEQLASMPEGEREVPLTFSEPAIPRYQNPRIEQLLHPDHDPRPGTFLVPSAAFGCIDRLAALAPAGMLMFAADVAGGIGIQTRESIRFPDDGYFHLSVDFDLIAAYARASGATFIRSYATEALQLLVLALGLDAGSLREVGHATDTYFGTFGQITTGGMRDYLHREQPFPSVQAVLALGAATQWDSVVFNMAAQFIIEQIRAGRVTVSERARLEAGLDAVIEGYHPRVDPPETYVNLGLVLNELGSFAEAANLFAQSWQLFGPTPETAFNIAMVCFAADDLPNTKLWLEKTVELNPQHVTARGWLAQLAYNESHAGPGSGPPAVASEDT